MTPDLGRPAYPPADPEELSAAVAWLEARHRVQLGTARRTPGRKARTLRALWEREHGICSLCEWPVAFEHATRDHVIPRSQGGREVHLAHAICNTQKSNGIEATQYQDGYLVVARSLVHHEQLTWFEPVPEELIHEAGRLVQRGLRLPKPRGRVRR